MVPNRTHKIQKIYQTPPQREFRDSPAWVRGFVAGRGSGKTLIGARDVLLRAEAGEPWMSVSPSYGVIHETTMPTLVQEARRLGVFVRSVKSPLPRVTFRTQDGGVANCVLRSGEDPEKLRGPNKAGLWIDEASIVHPDVFFLGVAVLRHLGKMGPVVLTFTPKGRNHWTFDCFFELARTSAHSMLSENGDGLYLESTNPDSGVVSRRKVYTYSGLNYVRKANSHLVHAKTKDNPFLPPEFYANIRSYYGSQLAAQELAGEFVDIEGLMFRRSWFQVVDEAPREGHRVRYWDRAATEGAGSYSAGVLMLRDARGIYFVEDVVRGQWSAYERDQVMKLTAAMDARKYNNEVLIYVEQEGGSGGKEAAQQAIVMLAGHPVYIDRVTGARNRRKDHQTLPGEAKIVRAQPFAAQCQAGNVRMVRNDTWNGVYLEELTAFPEYAHDDQVDASSGAFNQVKKISLFLEGTVQRTEYESKAAEQRYGIKHQRGATQVRPSQERDRLNRKGNASVTGTRRRPSNGGR